MSRVLHRIHLPARSGSPELPVWALQAARPGPRALITANLHGDELTGVAVVHTLLDRLEEELLCGAVVLYPSLNPSGLERGRRPLPEDDCDLNRCFPGDARGAPSARHAHALWEDLRARKPDLLIDLHSDSARALPYALIDRACRRPKGEREALEARCAQLAQATGFTVLHEYPDAEYLRFQLERSLTGAVVNQLGVAALTLECGPRSSLDPTAAQQLTQAVLGVLGAADMVAQPALVDPSRLDGGPWRRESGPRARHGGLFEPHRLPGQRFAPKDALCTLRSLDGQHTEVLRASSAGCVIALPERGWIPAGSPTGTLAVEGS